MAYGYFDEQSARRIANATRLVERMPRNQPRGGYPGGKSRGGGGQWVQIGEGSDGKYSWTAIIKNSDGDLQLDQENTGTYSDPATAALEINECDSVPEGTRVWLDQDNIFQFIGGIVKGTASATFTGSGQIETEINGENQTIDVEYNFSGQVTGGRLVYAGYGLDGTWYVLAEDCPPREDD